MLAVRELDAEALDALIERIKEAQASEMALPAEDLQLILNCLLSLVTLQTELSNHQITIHKLRKLVGMVNADERLKQQVAATQDSAAPADRPETTKEPKPRQPPAKRIPTQVEHHALTEAQKNPLCIECDAGSLSKYAPAEFIRVTGQSPYQVIKHVMERLRCNRCGAYYTAPMSAEAADDGEPGQAYGYSARTMMAIQKYYMGAPFYRQEGLQDLFHTPISASTIYDQSELVTNAVTPVFVHLKTLAARAECFELDDTKHRILSATEIQKPDRKTGKQKKRKAVNASGIIATLADDKIIVLFETSIGHAGEFLDSLLKQRPFDATKPITMSDALSSNLVYACDTIRGLCNAHARRQFYDLLPTFQSDADWVLQQYKLIWQHEDETEGMNDIERRDHHQQHSLPVMETIKKWGEAKQQQPDFEANSGLGKAIAYFLNHYHGLTRFCHEPGVPLDNNRMEGMLKIVIRNRKNAYFFKTDNGANVADIITSIIATCAQHGVNPFDYLIYLQRNHDAVKQRPQDFLPWSYQREADQKIE